MKKVLLLLGVLSLTDVWADTPVTPYESLKGDVKAGRLVFARCRTCHYPEKVVGHSNGPSLWNIFGQEVGSQAGFTYTKALKDSTLTWTPELLYFWLSNPKTMFPASSMAFAPLRNDQEKADLIEYLKGFKE